MPDILKQTQLKLQESQQLRQISERHCEDLSRELLDYKDKIETIQKEMDILRSENITLQVCTIFSIKSTKYVQL